MGENDRNDRQACNSGHALEGISSSAPPFDPERYRGMTADLEFTQEQKDELLLTLWEIMRAFVEMGFGADSIQRVLPSVFGEFSEASSDTLQLSGSNLKTDHTSPGEKL